ncbi:MAG: phosphoribosylanthranilate isomerase [Metallosphaera yellowstonensis]|uniref:N-(5'-phosphoribosyl)anthranilate isomerase n=1 Tax=Metallosphaera yellowstonensis MK1 TaxID=671065 RepID=H2C8C7_9CREN|nr:phosphoribosylanthranilate isomerase [Metallosphaera yellowstonensis]EHP68403.1 phosphoribosylanthranilate isomerase [Metallosphaera yellowstonensis MK1]
MVKVKICGIATREDAIKLDKLGVDYLGFLLDPVSPRFVKPEFLGLLQGRVSRPKVSVMVNRGPKDILSQSGKLFTDIFQFHRILSNEELDLIPSLPRKSILYVPASRRYRRYLEEALKVSDMILLDAERKGYPLDMSFVREVLAEYKGIGVGGGINLTNLREFVELDPGWIDVSRGVEDFPGKKNIELVRKLLKEVGG